MKLRALLLLTLGAGIAHGQAARPAPGPKPATKTKIVRRHSKTVVKRKPARPPRTVASSAPALLYKTKGDYADLVPVTLSEDRLSIVAYPAPSDLAGHLPRPTALAQGYWLDNRGIGPNTAFLKLTYADYAPAQHRALPGRYGSNDCGPRPAHRPLRLRPTLHLRQPHRRPQRPHCRRPPAQPLQGVEIMRG